MFIDGNTEANATKSLSRSPSLKINALSNWGALGVNIVVGFLLTPYIIACLGTARYGIWALIVSIIGYYGILDLGVRSAVARYVARYAGQKNYQSLNNIVNTAVGMFCLVGVIIACVSIFAADYITRFFSNNPEDYIFFKQLVWLLGIAAGLMFPCNVLAAVIIAHEHFVISNIIKIITTVLRGILIFGVLFSGGGLVGMGWVTLGAAIFETLANLLIIRTYFSYIHFSSQLINKTSIFTLLGFGIYAFVGKVGDLLRLRLDIAVIGRFLDMESVGVYGLAALLFGYVRNFSIACSGVTQPRLAAVAGKEDSKTLSKIIMTYSVFIANLSACLGLMAFLLAKDFISIWMPKNFEDINGATIVFSILLVGLLPELMTSVSVNALQALKKHKYYAYQTIIEGAVNLLLSILLVTKFGILGVALGTAVPAIIIKFLIQPVYFCRICKISWWSYLSKVLLKPLLVGSCIIASLMGSKILFTATSYPALVLKGIIILSLYSVISYFFCFDKQDQLRLLLKLTSLRYDIKGSLGTKQAISDKHS